MYLNIKLKLEILVTGGMGYKVLPTILHISKYKYVTYVLFIFKIFIPSYISIS